MKKRSVASWMNSLPVDPEISPGTAERNRHYVASVTAAGSRRRRCDISMCRDDSEFGHDLKRVCAVEVCFAAWSKPNGLVKCVALGDKPELGRVGAITADAIEVIRVDAGGIRVRQIGSSAETVRQRVWVRGRRRGRANIRNMHVFDSGEFADLRDPTRWQYGGRIAAIEDRRAIKRSDNGQDEASFSRIRWPHGGRARGARCFFVESHPRISVVSNRVRPCLSQRSGNSFGGSSDFARTFQIDKCGDCENH